MGRPRKDEGMKESGGSTGLPPAVEVDSYTPASVPSVKVGDVVMYGHRPMEGNPNAPSATPVPMMVTEVMGRVVSGVVFSHNGHFTPRGCKVVTDVDFGKGPGEWQHRP